MKYGLSTTECAKVLSLLSKAAAAVPFPIGLELRHMLMQRHQQTLGVFRFVTLGWWRAFFS